MHFILYDKFNHIIIDKTLLILKCIDKGFFTYLVNYASDSTTGFMDLLQSFRGEDFISTFTRAHMVCSILMTLYRDKFVTIRYNNFCYFKKNKNTGGWAKGEKKGRTVMIIRILKFGQSKETIMQIVDIDERGYKKIHKKYME